MLDFEFLELRFLVVSRAVFFVFRVRRCFESFAVRVFVVYLECESLLFEFRDGFREEDRFCRFDVEYFLGDRDRFVLRGLGERFREDRLYLLFFFGYLFELKYKWLIDYLLR